MRDRHAHYYVALAAALDEALRGPRQIEAFERFGAERDNLRAALAWLRDRDPGAALALAAAHCWFWFVRSQLDEGRETLRDALERAGPEPTEARGACLLGAGFLAFESGDFDEGMALFEEALVCARAAGSRRTESLALSMVAENTERSDEERIRLGQQAIAIAESTGEPWVVGVTTGNAGLTFIRLGRAEEGTPLIEQAGRLCREAGDASMTALYLDNLAFCALVAGNPGEARAKSTEALELARQIEDTRTIAVTILHLAWAALLDEDLDRARSNLLEAATLARRVGRRAVVAAALWGFAQIAAAEDDPVRAARLAGAATELGRAGGYDLAKNDALTHHIRDARVGLGERGWETAWADGTGLDLDAALALALAPSRDREAPNP
jgi:tetratricopeptide (TPR) repeat protein